jgi:hypothetical protein
VKSGQERPRIDDCELNRLDDPTGVAQTSARRKSRSARIFPRNATSPVAILSHSDRPAWLELCVKAGQPELFQENHLSRGNLNHSDRTGSDRNGHQPLPAARRIVRKGERGGRARQPARPLAVRAIGLTRSIRRRWGGSSCRIRQ